MTIETSTSAASTTTTSSSSPTAPAPASDSRSSRRRQVLRAATASIVPTVLANLAILGVAELADADVRVPERPGSDVQVALGVPAVVMASVLPLLVATGLAVLLGRRARGTVIFSTVVALGFVLSFVPMLTSDLNGATLVTVGLMHPVVAAAAWLGLRSLTRPAGAR